MPPLNIEKSIHITAPIEQVFASVRDFKQWQAWSPWLLAEPGCKVTHAADGDSYAWDGQIVGAGEMAVNGGAEPTSIFYRLIFLKPWKFEAEVQFKFAEKDGGTQVTWAMQSSLPIFMFWMRKQTEGLIGMDYRRGLLMLKDHIETREILSSLTYAEQVSIPGCQFIGLRTTCSMEHIGKRMGDDFTRLHKWVAEHDVDVAGPPLSIYHEFKADTGITTYTAAIPVDVLPNRLGDSLIAGRHEGAEVYQVTHTGSYRHIGNGWASGMMHKQAKLFRQNKKIAPFEIYLNHPDEVAEAERITQINFPCK